VVLLIYGRRLLALGLLLMALPLLLLLIPMAVSNPGAVAADLEFTVFRISVSPLMQLVNVMLMYGELIQSEVWVVLGLVGLFLLPGHRARSMVLFVACATILILVRSLAPVGRNLHHLIPVFPLLALGLASFLDRAIPRSLEIVRTSLDSLFSLAIRVVPTRSINLIWRGSRTLLTSGIVFVFVISPLVWAIMMDVGDSVYGQSSLFAADDHGLSAEKDVDAVIHYLSTHVTPRDLVLASPQVAWAMPTLQADFAQALAIEGQDARVLPELPPQRFAFDCSLEGASYVVLDRLSSEWAPRLIPAIDGLISKVLQWPLVFTAGDLKVYRNPSR
jgi:hypothetical protein